MCSVKEVSLVVHHRRTLYLFELQTSLLFGKNLNLDLKPDNFGQDSGVLLASVFISLCIVACFSYCITVTVRHKSVKTFCPCE